jgi:hypothetical protein
LFRDRGASFDMSTCHITSGAWGRDHIFCFVAFDTPSIIIPPLPVTPFDIGCLLAYPIEIGIKN